MKIRGFLLSLFTLATFAASAGDKIKVYFNHTVDNSVSTGVNAVNLNGYIDDTLVAYINRAKYTMDIAVYNFTSTSSASLANVATAINSAYSRGVKVRWIYDGAQTNSGMTLLNTGIPTLGSPTSGSYTIMHDKFLIIDGKSSNPADAIVWTGSTNWSIAQFETDYDNVVILQDSALAHAYIGEFNQMWGDTGMTPNSATSRFGHTKVDLGRHNFVIEGKPVELYFSPSDNTNSHILSAIATADKDLYFAMFAFTYGSDATAIVARKTAGVYVAGIMDTFSANSSYTPYGTFVSGLTRAYFKVYSGAGLYHNKYMIVDPSDVCSDPLVLTGSHNWSSAANTDNDENTLIIHDDTIANLYYQSFKADFASMGGALTAVTGCHLGVNNARQQPEMILYPNPAKGSFTLNLDITESQRVTIVLAAADGRQQQVLLDSWMNSGTLSRQFSIATPGMYVLKVITGEKVTTTRIINE